MKTSKNWIELICHIFSILLIFALGIMCYVSISLVGEVNFDLIDTNTKTLFASVMMLFLTLYSLLFLRQIRSEWKKE